MDRLADRFHVLAYRARLAYRTGDNRLGASLERDADNVLRRMYHLRQGARK